MAATWLLFTGQDECFERSVLTSCEESGLAPYRFDPTRSTSDPGLLFFDDVDDEVLRLLDRVSSSGLRRVIAIRAPDKGLERGVVYKLRRSGASHVCIWAACKNPLAEIAACLARWSRVDETLDSPELRSRIVGGSPGWIRELRRAVDIAVFGDSHVPILIMGETGTGKELVARLIHDLDPRADKGELVLLDASAVPPALSHSEFFGHERGAFTGAHGRRDGAFSLAGGGTLFIDEVGELCPELQCQILRAVQERSFKPVGGSGWSQVDFRLVCATQRDLAADVDARRFRRDLYHRLRGCTITLPPLRRRAEDIIPLAEHFLTGRKPGLGPSRVDESLREYLLTRSYSGNVRELEHLVLRIHHRHTGNGDFTLADVPEDDLRVAVDAREELGRTLEPAAAAALRQGVGFKAFRRAADEAAVSAALRIARGKRSEAAALLQVSSRALRLRLQDEAEAERRAGSRARETSA